MELLKMDLLMSLELCWSLGGAEEMLEEKTGNNK